MKALAEFILRGRVQALIVALVGSFFPLVSSATVGLVALCKGYKEGFLLFLWASLPLVVMQQVGSENMLLTAVSVASLGIMVIAASLHSVYASWQWTLIAAVVIAIICAVVFGFLMAADVTELLVITQQMFETLQSADAPVASGISEPLVLGLVAVILAVGCVMSLLLARWWQSAVYNPGGFQKEFHGFTISSKVAVILLALFLIGRLIPEGYQLWADLALLPFLLAGIAMIHSTIKLYGLGSQWVALLYIGMILVGKPVTLILVVLGLTDSLIDLRSRLEGYKNSKT
ncbi:MAG: hypothetical protein ACPHV4_01590 [Porticoccaceae bacterium]